MWYSVLNPKYSFLLFNFNDLNFVCHTSLNNPTYKSILSLAVLNCCLFYMYVIRYFYYLNNCIQIFMLSNLAWWKCVTGGKMAVLEPSLFLSFLQADVDNNFTIDYGEFLAPMHLNKVRKDHYLFAAFSYFDKDGRSVES